MSRRIAFVAIAALTFAARALAQEKPPEGALIPGVTVWIYDIGERLNHQPQIVQGQTPNAYHVLPQIKFDHPFESPFGPIKQEFVGDAHGWLSIDRPGSYQFKIDGSNGASLVLDGKELVALDASSSYTMPVAVDLTAGLHPISVPFYVDLDDCHVHLSWQPPGAKEFAPIPPENLKTEAGQTYVTAPGPKRWYYADHPLAPGDGCPLTGVHPSMTLENFRGPDFKPQVGAMAFLPDGRLAIATWDRVGAVYILDNLDGKEPGGVRVKRFAAGLGEPLGMAVVNGDILVTQKQEITRLRDTDGDGVADVYEMVAGGWPASHNYHEFSFNLQPHDGSLFITTSVPLKSGDTNYTPGTVQGYATPGGPGSCFKINSATGAWEIFARGLRAPNGMGIGPDGILMCCDNQGDWHPASRLNVLRKGGFYGHQVSPTGKEPFEPPLVWFPQGEIGNSPTQPVLIPEGPYERQIFVGDVTYGGIQRVYAENIRGVWQGAVFRFTSGLESGVNRLAWGPDGCLYVGGIGSNGNWNWNNTKFGLQRLRPNAHVPFEMKTIQSRAGGMLVTFTTPVDTSEGAPGSKPESYQVRCWRYEPTVRYGGPKVDLHALRVDRVALAPDGLSAFLGVEGLQEGTVVHVRLAGLHSAAGEKPWTTEGWYTLNRISDTPGPGFPITSAKPVPYTQRPADAVVVLDASGKTDLGQSDGSPLKWPVEHGELVVNPAAGDVITPEPFGDCFVHAEWLAPAGGEESKELNANSGIKLEERYEIQILGSPGPPHAPGPSDAGAIYKKKAATINVSTGPGTWQTYDILFTAPRWEQDKKTANARVSLWWNGVLVQDNVEVNAQTGVSAAESPGDHPLLLQAHASDADAPVRFRNVWVERR